MISTGSGTSAHPLLEKDEGYTESPKGGFWQGSSSSPGLDTKTTWILEPWQVLLSWVSHGQDESKSAYAPGAKYGHCSSDDELSAKP